MICDLWPTITIISWYSDSAIINISQDNHIMIHHDICLTEEYDHHHLQSLEVPPLEAGTEMWKSLFGGHPLLSLMPLNTGSLAEIFLISVSDFLSRSVCPVWIAVLCSIIWQNLKPCVSAAEGSGSPALRRSKTQRSRSQWTLTHWLELKQISSVAMAEQRRAHTHLVEFRNNNSSICIEPYGTHVTVWVHKMVWKTRSTITHTIMY